MTDVVGVLAGVLLLMSGAFEILQGAAAIANGDLYSAGSDFLYQFNMTVWGWVHLVIGVLSIIVGIGILGGRSWALVAGMIIAGLSAIANFAFLPHYPLWAITVIAVDLLIIHALSVQLRRA
jgi:membrane-associated PAP2 superfamily phosphatase